MGDLVEERGFYDFVLIPLVRELFGIDPYRYVRKGKSAYAVHFKSKKLVEYLASELDFPIGDVTKYVPRLMTEFPDKIRLAFIRGLFDADGSLVLSCKTYRNHVYPTVEIKTVSYRLAVSVRQILISSGFRCCVNKSAESWIVRTNGKEMLELWMSRIGSRNIKHLSKYLVWKKDGKCPPNTTVSQRMDIIKSWGLSPVVKS